MDRRCRHRKVVEPTVQLVPITTYDVSSSQIHGEVYSMQHCEIKFFSDLRQIAGFLRVLPLPQSTHFVVSGGKHHTPTTRTA